MSLFYNVSMHKPTRVLNAVRANLVADDTPNLILNHGTSLGVWALPEGGLPVAMFDVPIFAEVEALEAVPLHGHGGTRHALHVTTAGDRFCVLAYNDSTKSVVTLCSGEIKDPMGVPCEVPCMAVHHASSTAFYHRSTGYLRVAPYHASHAPIESNALQSYALPTDRDIVALAALEGYLPDGTVGICALTADARNRRSLMTFSVNLEQRKMPQQLAYLSIENVESTAGMLVPVHSTGVMLVGDNYVTLAQKDFEPITAAFETEGGVLPEWPSRTCCARVDSNTFVIGSISGRLHIVHAQPSSVTARALALTVSPSAIVPLPREGTFFIGSKLSDSVLLSTSPDGSDATVLDTM
eukprot:PhM_4_TR3051/c0_g1_i2/m.97790/K10610/DDB1; DNA damage-binding protein 1